MRACTLTGLIAYPLITSCCALTGLIAYYSLILITFTATVFTNSPIIASTLIDFACTLFYFILLPSYIQLYSTVVNAAFNAAAILQSLLVLSHLSITMYHILLPQIKGNIRNEQVWLANNPVVLLHFQQTIAKWFVITFTFGCGVAASTPFYVLM